MRCCVALSAVLWCLITSLAWAHGGEDHSHAETAPANMAQPANRLSAQSGLIEAVLVADTGNSALDLYLSDQRSNAPLSDAEIDVSGLALAAPVQTIGAGHYRLALSAPLGNEPQPLALTISANINAETVLELLDMTLQPAADADSHSLAAVRSTGSTSEETGTGFSPAIAIGFISGLVAGLLLTLWLLRRTQSAKAVV